VSNVVQTPEQGLTWFPAPVRQVLDFERITPEPGADADAVAHEFLARVTADGPGVLEIGGIATVWDLLVDDAVVASGQSMFERRIVEVGPGDHEVRIVVHPLTELLDELPTKPRQRWRTMLVQEARLRWVRTQLLGRAPGFSPGPPVVGPYLPVTLVTGPRVGSRLKAWLEGSTGVVEVDGGERLEFPDVELWWPHTHGSPRRYDVKVDGEVVGKVGFRTVENRSETGSLDLWVNGVRVFCRGAVWTPGDLAALDEAVGLGLNLVRVPGIAAYESDAFHDRCDELGLLVWQDLMFATFDYPLADEAFVATVTAEVSDQCARLLGHPSTVVVCGSAEHEQQAAMFGVSASTGYAAELAALQKPLVEASGLDAIWVDSSPSGGDPVTRVDTGIGQYFGVGAYLRDLPDARHSQVKFASECLAFSNLTDPVVPGLPGNEGVPQDNGADWDFADVREHYLRQRYGDDPTEADAQRVTGEVMADVFGEWRRPTSGCGGGIVLWLRDVVPGAGWGLLDHEGRPKPAALALAPALQATALWIVDEGLNGLDVHIANDGPEPLGGTLTVGLLRDDGSPGESAEAPVVIPAHGHQVTGIEALLGRFADVSYAYRFGPPPHAGVRARLVTESGVEREAVWRVPLTSLG
jgi:beta-mannosidase